MSDKFSQYSFNEFELRLFYYLRVYNASKLSNVTYDRSLAHIALLAGLIDNIDESFENLVVLHWVNDNYPHVYAPTIKHPTDTDWLRTVDEVDNLIHTYTQHTAHTAR
jgi:hypothetical protein